MKLTIALVAACLGGHAATSGSATAAESFQLIKSPDGVVYKLTAQQLNGIAASDPDKCKPKCLIILAYGREWRVPIGSLAAYKLPTGTAEQLIKGGSIPVAARVIGEDG